MMKTLQLITKSVSALVLLSMTPLALADTSKEGVVFPDLNDSWLKTGDFIGTDHIRRVKPGLDKDQVALQIGNPHFTQGFLSSSEWNYAFNFYTGVGGEYVTCQYQVIFDKANTRVASTHWKDQQCAAWVAEKVAEKPVARVVTMGTDGVFMFGKAGLADILPNGRQKIMALAQKMTSEYQINSLQIVGHTDRIGSEASNLALSRARAETVKVLLAQSGVPAELISTKGVGSSQPLVNCAGGKSAAVIACLQPNRRFEATFMGTPRN